ncbi:MAG: hypothetical protein MSA47_03965 [Christensenellaceae bacterium]|nr:hypothetical protein [Christensenellaceae bacterium]
MIYYYLNNDKLKAMFATTSGKRVAVKEFFDMDFPSEFLNDPSATNIDLQLTEAMLDMIRKNEIKAKSAKFVLENSKIPFREMILPYAKPSILYPIISSELFTDKKLADNHTVDYVEIDRNIDDPEEVAAALNAPAEGEEDVSDGEEKKKKAKKARLMVTYIDNLVIENLRKCCREVGMKLTAVDISQNALSKLVSFMKDDLPQYFVLVDYRITTITSYLFADYKHVFSLTKPIYSMPNENYANEMAFFINDFSSIVSEAIQFFRSKYTDYKFDDVYITGDLDKFQSVENDLYGFMGLNVKMLPLPDSVTGMEQLEFNSFAPLIGTMLK